jgi:diguanylate cyclase (GGDEF)-like protein
VLAFAGVSLTVLVAVFVIYSLSQSIRKLKRATHRIAAGDFSYDPHIPPGDEIGDLAQDFMQMAARLKELEELSLDASPLTRLPGNIAIERAINHRLHNESSFAMCYLDLDNFKSYNDRYGYIKASEMLQEAGRVIHEAVRTVNDPDAFVGHIGGDDFVVIVTADAAEQVCRAILAAIDAMVLDYYTDEDRGRGYIEGEDRYGVFRKFPLVSISIAALICRPGDYGSAAEIATAAARVKDRVKEASGSNFSIVHRSSYDAV